MEHTAKCQAAVKRFLQADVNLLAIDFDRTLVTEHTWGQWQGTSLALSTHVRPLFRELIPIAIDNNIHIAIVTFSGQTKIIGEVLRTVFPNHASRITLRACDNSWGNMGTARDGKQMFMASAVAEIQEKFDCEISRKTTVLIDDDGRNIEIALKNNVRALLFLPDEDAAECFFCDVERFIVDKRPSSRTIEAKAVGSSGIDW
jgi:hypothetical protein